MWPLFRKKQPQPAVKTTLSLPHTTGSSTTLSPLDLPEVLDLIFSYLDEYTLRHTALLVCRQWLQMNQERVTREVVWDFRWNGTAKLDSVLPKVLGADRLEFIVVGDEANSIFNFPNRPAQKLMTTYLQLYQDGGGEEVIPKKRGQYSFGIRRNFQQHQLHSIFYHPLKELEAVFYRFARDEYNLFPYPKSLTTLKIEMGYSLESNFSLQFILKALPLLEYFHGVKGGGWHIAGPWVPPDHGRQQTLRLRALELYYPSFHQADLEQLLMVTPRLKTLKLVGVMGGRPEDATLGKVKPDYNRMQLFHHLKALSFTLDMLHFSLFTPMPEDSMDDTDDDDNGDNEGFNQMARELCPNLTEWSLWSPKTTSTLLKELETMPNVVTTLEVFWVNSMMLGRNPCKYKNQWSTPRLIHQYLCASPHLLHLRTMRMQYMIGGMDLHRRSEFRQLSPVHSYGWTEDPESIRPGIWACRKLRVLHMEIHDHDNVQISSAVNSRIIFGYLSRVCPKLEEIDIRAPYQCFLSRTSSPYSPGMCTQLEGGLCLLSRLPDLRKLRVCSEALVEAFGCGKVDLVWMTPAGNSRKERKRRQSVIATWGVKLEIEQTLEAERLQSGVAREPLLASDEIPTDAEILDQLKDLGRLSEVKAVLEAMDVDGFRCLKRLTQLSLGSALAQRPEEVIKRLFPSSKFFR
ncbi:hypothetical protein BGX33_000471 [Mortierella sp. NVP41]|nr:hypothetical protein BGX33_000471 [Mortierella sp. NVP41]